ncbi:NAD-dependent epimerase/dehydratase family protein [Enterococcus sp. HY326]|uniref:NAD-dependent epimerase/dehydratase family protein n=1 Tax=Enterococcus sp. HY326 TaxID=2971265 RepID=UPI00223F5C91|nr:NAD-dependent epimerase/dehydratase family protein [Enterococcus sp. HY326]
MKKILITGEKSYIGDSFIKWAESNKNNFQIDVISVRGNDWRDKDFSCYDSIFHVAGIAHADVSNVNNATKELYYKINCDLAVEVANKYKKDLSDKSGQFIYMSSIIVYGEENRLKKDQVITDRTIPRPSNFYGDSKLQAEKNLLPLNEESFKMVILRPPMIYGPKSKGNFPQLVKLAEKIPIFPQINNRRSMLFIDNLFLFLEDIIENFKDGVFFPQNDEYVNTSYLVKLISTEKGKKIFITRLLNGFVILLCMFPGKIGKLSNKVFGNLCYEKKANHLQLIDFRTSIKRSLEISDNE